MYHRLECFLPVVNLRTTPTNVENVQRFESTQADADRDEHPIANSEFDGIIRCETMGSPSCS